MCVCVCVCERERERVCVYMTRMYDCGSWKVTLSFDSLLMRFVQVPHCYTASIIQKPCSKSLTNTTMKQFVPDPVTSDSKVIICVKSDYFCFFFFRRFFFSGLFLTVVTDGNSWLLFVLVLLGLDFFVRDMCMFFSAVNMSASAVMSVGM